jgi:hypothetical protein
LSCKAEALDYKPRRFLSNFDVFSEGSGGESFRVIGNYPNRYEPFLERKLRFFENGPDLDRESPAAGPAFERFTVAEMVNMAIAAIRAKLAVTPTDLAQTVEASLLVWKL